MRDLAMLLIILLSTATALLADSVFSNQRQVTKLTEGVYTIRHKDPYPGWVDGNTTVIIGDREVLVVDSCQISSSALEDIAQIRQWTQKPVRYLVNTHWHLDHTGGNHDYMEAFPGLAIVAQIQTLKMMDAMAVSLPAAGVKDARKTQAKLQEALKSGKKQNGKPLTDEDKTKLNDRLGMIDRILAQLSNHVYAGPTLAFERELNIDLGNRKIKLKYLGKGNTAGDAVVYLPKERILVTGDLLDHPVPYAFDGYPSQWAKTLQSMAELDAQTFVPGHGEVLHSKEFLYRVIDLLNSVVSSVEEQLDQNQDATLDEVKNGIDLKAFRDSLAGSDSDNTEFFDDSIGSFIELAYHEAKQR